MLSLLALPSAVAAQTAPPAGDITATLVSVEFNGETYADLTNQTLATRGFNSELCNAAASVELTIQLGNLPAGQTFVDAWIGNASNVCSNEAARVTGNERLCKNLDVDPMIAATNQITITLADLADLDGSVCNATVATGETYRLWLLATGNTETTGPITASQWGYVTFIVDVKAPTTPTPVSTSTTGGTSIPVEWTASTSEGMLRFNVYVDTSISSCGDVGEWAAGDDAPTGETPINTADTTARVNSDANGLTTGRSALVFITALDLAENESVLSAPVCITRVDTAGFCEALEAGGEECTDSCAAALPRSRTAPGALLLGLALVALVVRRRKR